jgi:hypothetical protein
MWAIVGIIIHCLNLMVITCVMNQSQGHWLLSNFLTTIINLIMAMESKANPFLKGMKHLTNFRLNSTCLT